MKPRDHRPNSKFDLRRAENHLDRIELLIKRQGGELRDQLRWAANLSEPASRGGDIGYRRAPGHSNPTESNANDSQRAAITHALKRAHGLAQDADGLLEDAYGILLDALGGRQTIARGGDSGSWTTNQQMEALRAMQVKRAAQGGGFGGS